MPDPIADLQLALPSGVAAAVSTAERAVDSLNRDPPRIASLEVLARRLLRSESVASSRIEGLVLTQRRLARAEVEAADARDETARSVLGNVVAMEHAVALGASASPNRREDILDIHRQLMLATETPGIDGLQRERQNWIGGTAYNPAHADFVPPPPEYVSPLLDDLATPEPADATFKAGRLDSCWEPALPDGPRSPPLPREARRFAHSPRAGGNVALARTAFSVFLAMGVLAACDGGEEVGWERCDQLDVRLDVANEGWYALEGTADGRPFRCSFYFEYDGWGEHVENVYFGGTCAGPARIAGDRRLAFEGTPATVTWTAGPTDAFSAAVHEPRSGGLELEYRAYGACPAAEVDLASR